MIQLKNVSLSFQSERVLSNVSLSIDDGQFIGIIGQNGAGKTTLIRLILGILKPTSGQVIRTKGNVSYVSQTTSLSDSSFPSSVEEIVSLGLAAKKRSPFFSRVCKTRVEETLKAMGIFDLRKKLLGELSGGQLQKVKIAKALVSSPSVIVLDEPEAGMDEKSHGKLIETIESLHAKSKMTVIFVSHHKHDLAKADRVFSVNNGKVLSVEGDDENVPF